MLCLVKNNPYGVLCITLKTVMVIHYPSYYIANYYREQ